VRRIAPLLLTAMLGMARAVAAREVVFPLAVDHAVLAALLAQHLGIADDRPAVPWEGGDRCRYLRLRSVAVASAGSRVRVRARTEARIGFRLLGFCIAPVRWSGYLETDATPTVGADWQLRLGDLDSRLLDDAGRPAAISGRLWTLVKGRVEDEVRGFALDLAPPVEETRALLRASVAPERAAPVLDVLQSLRPLATDVGPDAITVRVACDVPDASPPAPPAPEPALDAATVARWEQRFTDWDGFLVFVVKDLGVLDAAPGVRDALFALLLESRYEILDILARGPTSAEDDPVRRLFLEAWEGLRAAVKQAAAHGVLGDRALRYASFLAAGDALAALDAAAPALGLELSADGLRRLARVLEPGYAGDPLAAGDEEDPALRDLFGFHEPLSGATPVESPATGWWRLAPRSAHAAEDGPDLAALARRLDRWVPRREEFDAYRDQVGRMLTLVARRTADTNRVDHGLQGLYQDIALATAWQESCWRQFVRVADRVTYLESSTGDIGIMQVNRRVWRGFFDLEKLRWDAIYNAGAGSEILAQLLVRYGVREGGTRRENAARATYSAYNGGPAAYRRYRQARVSRMSRAVDRAFWDKFRAMAAGKALDYVLCVESWPGGASARLSMAAPGSMP
jgi:transglycosylase-like protein with SLT domain